MKISLSSFHKWNEFFLSLGLLLTIAASSIAQTPLKSDYIVVADSALSQGKIRDIPTEGNTVIFFTRSTKKNYEKYSIAEITEFRVSERVFFRKEIQVGGEKELVFLEKLSNSIPKAIFWRLNGETDLYYLETPEGIEILGDSFREQLGEALGNPLLDPLLELTRRNDFSLVYLARTANTIKKPRTFSKLFTLTPSVGYSSQSVQFKIPDSNQIETISGSSPAFGLNGEAFLTFKRNLSLNIGMLWTQFDAQGYFEYEYDQKAYESDVFMDFSLLQVPVTAKYYLDLTPNKWRLFGEVGYSYAIPSYDQLGVYQAEFRENEIVTSTKEFEMSENFSGYNWGIGIERYLSKHRGLVLGIRQFKVTGTDDEFVQGLTFQLGYKF